MKDKMFNIKQIVLTVIFLGALSLMGMITGEKYMVAVYGAAMIIISGIIFLFVRRKQRHSEISSERSRITGIIAGIVLCALALITPLLLVLKSNVINVGDEVTAMMGVITLVVTILFIGLFALAVYLINYKGEGFAMRALGYLIVIIASLIPGILMSRFDKNTSTIGSIYYVALAVLIMSYNGINFLLPKE
ncbi:MAG TPA: hypothetical protein PL126_06090 [Candidatus Cloacimonadota bacterium]|nr:hypothetical protein [Candidatus Cloacimonadota bacterium]